MRYAYFIVLHFLRQPLYFLRNCRVAWSSWIARGAVLVNSTVGAYSYLGGGAYLITTQVGRYCSIASGAKIGGMEHSWWWGSTSFRLSNQNISSKETIIEDDVWVGSNAVIRQGVRIGRGAVVGAGAIVLKDVSSYSIVAGIPAKEIRKRFDVDTIQKIAATRFWEHTPKEAKKLLLTINFCHDSHELRST